MKKKAVALFLTAVLLLGCVIGGTVAWLMDVTTEVKNTFTVGDVDIELNETTGEEYKMVPGNTISKDPKVTVEAGSEPCWLFIEITESENLDDFISYGPADGWLPLTDANGVAVAGVYYRDASAGDSFYVLAGDEYNPNGIVTVKGTVTKQMMDALTDATLPTLTFKAYAVQKANVDSVAKAWELAQTAPAPTPVP